MWLPILYRKRWLVQFLTAKKLIKLQLLKICWKYNWSKNCFNPQMIKNTVFFYKQTSSMIWSGNKVVVQMFCLTFRLCRHRHWHWGEKRDVENLPAAFILSVFSFFFFSFVSAVFLSLFLCFFLSFFFYFFSFVSAVFILSPEFALLDLCQPSNKYNLGEIEEAQIPTLQWQPNLT